MSNEAIFLVPLLLIVVAILLLWRSGRRRQALGVPEGSVAYRDTQERPGKLLTSERHGLIGRPDLLIEQGGVIIPIENKTGKTPARPYRGHVMQLIAYCVLVEETYGVRPPHGIIRYPAAQFEIAFSEALEVELEALIGEMAEKRRLASVARSHHNPRVCAACDYRSICDQRVEEQLTLLPDG
ncbi:MAG: CRISPR-associated protein Cas4 [Anaerolineae bacterium]|nr:CRISPR-associated protein Cas4 [Anaerolineae bacterium]